MVIPPPLLGRFKYNLCDSYMTLYYITLIISDMEVSWNRGTSKTSILIGFSIRNHSFGGIPMYGTPFLWSAPMVEPWLNQECDDPVLQPTGEWQVDCLGADEANRHVWDWGWLCFSVRDPATTEELFSCLRIMLCIIFIPMINNNNI